MDRYPDASGTDDFIKGIEYEKNKSRRSNRNDLMS